MNIQETKRASWVGIIDCDVVDDTLVRNFWIMCIRIPFLAARS